MTLFNQKHITGKKSAKITKVDLSQASLEDLVALIEKQNKERKEIEVEIDKLVREEIALLPAKKQKRLKELEKRLCKIT